MALKRWQFLLLTGIGSAALALVFVTTSLSGSIGTIRGQLDERQQFINETMLLSRLNVQLAQVLANLAVATGDAELRQLLADNGITFTVETERGDSRASIAPGAAVAIEQEGQAR
jgi:hypothetical protein